MNPETQKALEAFVLQVVDAAKTGASWTAEQTPLLVQEWLRWELAQSIIWTALPFLSIILLSIFGWIVLPRIVYRNSYERERDENREIGRTVGGLVSLAVSIAIFFGGFVPAILYTIKVLVAPRVVVFEKFMELVK